MTYRDQAGLPGENTATALLQDAPAKRISKAKAFCGITN